VLPYQTLLLRIGMVAVPLIAMIAAYIILAKKYKIDEAEYERIRMELDKKHA